MARPRPEGPDTLDRWKGEALLAHRGLLLWAAQRPAERSFRAVGRAVGRGESTVRKWAGAYRWEERASAPAADEVAVVMYRSTYMKRFGKKDWQHVEERCSFLLHTTQDAPPPSDAAEVIAGSRESELMKAMDSALPKPKRDRLNKAARSVEDEVNRRRSEQKEALNKEAKILDVALGYAIREMQKNKVRVSLRDVPMLIEAKRDVQKLRHHIAAPEETKRGDTPIVESSRVRYAKLNGHSVLQAMKDDTDELAVILGALCAKEEHQAELAAIKDVGGTDE